MLFLMSYVLCFFYNQSSMMSILFLLAAPRREHSTIALNLHTPSGHSLHPLTVTQKQPNPCRVSWCQLVIIFSLSIAPPLSVFMLFCFMLAFVNMKHLLYKHTCVKVTHIYMWIDHLIIRCHHNWAAFSSNLCLWFYCNMVVA